MAGSSRDQLARAMAQLDVCLKTAVAGGYDRHASVMDMDIRRRFGWALELWEEVLSSSPQSGDVAGLCDFHDRFLDATTHLEVAALKEVGE